MMEYPNPGRAYTLFRRIHEQWVKDFNLADSPSFAEQLRQRWGDAANSELEERLKAYLVEHTLALAPDEQGALSDRLMAAFLGCNLLERLLGDDSLYEIMVNGPEQVFVGRRGRYNLERIASPFEHEDEVLTSIRQLLSSLGVAVDEAHPLQKVRLPDGSLITVVIRPISLVGPCITMNKFKPHNLVMDDLLRFGSLTNGMIQFIQACLDTRQNILISGTPASGKISLTNIIGSLINANQRVISVEKNAEYQFRHEHLISLESRPPREGMLEVTLNDLLRTAVDMQPEWIIVGELEGAEIFDLLQIADRGSSILAVTRGGSAEDALERLEMLIKFHRPELPVAYLRMLTSSSIDIIIQQSRMPDGSRKVVQIAEVLPLQDGQYRLNYIYRFQQTGRNEQGRITGQFVSQPLSPRLAQQMASRAIQLPPELLPPV
ncbi:MAG: CpaF family protein [Oscillochloris sp.]|nr:CpaF family protein [Oscillochloris sp.]